MSEAIAKIAGACRVVARFPFILATTMLVATLSSYVGGLALPPGAVGWNQRTLLTLAAVIPLSLIAAMSMGAFYFALSRLAQDEPVTVSSAFRAALQRLWPLFWTPLLSDAAIILGAFLCILPGIYLSLRFSLVLPVVMLEGLSGRSALSRSWRLTEEYLFPILILGALSIPCELARLALAGAFSGVNDSDHLQHVIAHWGWSEWMKMLPVDLAFATVGNVALFLIYWDSWPKYVPPEPRPPALPPEAAGSQLVLTPIGPRNGTANTIARRGVS
ncbi:MAG: glycerophosphoryl diester phosphodiesterase membrane domain-containing protein [Candidatus Hydrogenedentes bacterium]|nr:glycerophosphoryl diester phosphodiesterase membrane domain-containing protein [Candidatus Hydrogenedentota bacterium]